MGRPDLARYDVHPESIGRSGAQVLRLRPRRGAGEMYLKTAPGVLAQDVRDESDRVAWLHSAGIPGPRLLEAGWDEQGAWMLCTAVPGRSLALTWAPPQLPTIATNVADAVRALHALDLAECPFPADLARRLPRALQRAATGQVDTTQVEAPRRGWTAERLAAELQRTVPAREDLAVTHGDLCAPNILLDPDTLTVTGFVDLGRLGVADRHQDLALFERSVVDRDLNPHLGQAVATDFLRRYAVPVDRARMDFYRLLDEF